MNFEEAYQNFEGFTALTRAALLRADEAKLGHPYAALLWLLEDCYEAPEYQSVLYRQKHQGATYKTLAAIAHAVGMTKAERVGWYRVAEAVPLSQRHAGHILSRLRRWAA